MNQAPQAPTGSIYDLGYRGYEGERLGRSHAFNALFVYSLRASFGIGRSLMSKAFPMGLAGLAFTPALIQLSIAALSPAELQLFTAENYFSQLEIALALFCAVVAPEIVGRDQRNRTLVLYFSRALQRHDYVSAKAASLFVALLGVLVLPQVLLYFGNAVAAPDLLAHLYDNLHVAPPVLGSSLVIAAYFTATSLAIASYSSNRALSTGMVLSFYVILTNVGRGLVEGTTGTLREYVLFLSPYDLMEGTVAWLFGSHISSATTAPNYLRFLAMSGQEPWLFFLGAVTSTLVALAVLYRRFSRLQV